MHVDDWVERLADAVDGGPGAVRDVLAEAARDPEALASIDFAGPLCTRVLVRSPRLTVTAHRWPAGMKIPRHEHRMGSIVAVLSGAEIHRTASGDHRVAAGEVFALGEDDLHALETDCETVAVHAYLGDLHGTERTVWDPVTGQPSRLDERLVPRLEEALARREREAPIPPQDVARVGVELYLALGDAPEVPPLRTPSGVAYEDRGVGRPVVFVHGLTYGRRTWDAVVERLPDLRCVALDLPGHGDTADGVGLEHDDAIAAVREVVRTLGLVDPVIVGHSAGAVIATRYTERYGAGGLVLVDQPLLVRPFAEIVRSLAPLLRGPAFPKVWERFERSMGYRSLPHAARSALLQAHHVRQEVVTAAWRMLMDGDADALERDLDAALRGLRVPVLSLHGADVGPYAGWLRARVPHAQVEGWPGHGHFPHLADPVRFAQRLRTFARGVGPMRLESVAGCVRTPVMAAMLEVTGVPWTIEWVGEGHFTARGERGPALYDGAERLTELAPMMNHVAERVGRADDETRGWIRRMFAEVAPAMVRLRAGPDPDAERTVAEGLAALGAALTERDWLGGEFGPADLAGISFGGVARSGLPVPPPIGAWAARVAAHPGVRRALARVEG